MRIRVATGLDEHAALDVLRADGEVTGRQPSKARLAAVRATLRAPTTLTLVADDGGTVVGLLLAEFGRRDDGAGPVDPGLLELSLLCVAPQVRRCGTGRALVRALLDRFSQVAAWASAPAAVTLLQQEGFVPTGRTAEVRGAPAQRLVRFPR